MQFFGSEISFKVGVGLLFGLLVLGITVLGILSHRNNRASIDTLNAVRHSQQVINQVEEISDLYKDLQLESNAFFITGDSTLIPLYRQAKLDLWKGLEEIRALTAENPNHRQRVDSLAELFAGLINSTDSVFLMAHNEAEMFLPDKLRNNMRFRHNIRKHIQQLKHEENLLLGQRKEESQATLLAFNRAFYLLLGGIGLSLLTAFFSIRHYFNKRARTQQELEKANDLFEKLFYESPTGLMITDASGKEILDCNNAFLELVNYDKEEVISNRNTKERIKLQGSKYLEFVQVALEMGQLKEGQLKLKPKGKTPIWVSVSLQSVHLQNKEHILFALTDLTIHKKAEREIKKAWAKEKELNKLKSNFVTLASHEFRTPLSTILSSSFLLRNLPLSENQELVIKHLDRIKSSVNNLTLLLDEFLNITKIEEGKFKPKPEKLNLQKFINDYVLEFSQASNLPQRILYSHTGEDEVLIDPFLLEIILHNLLSNAVKYSPEDSPVFLSTSNLGQLNVTVRDSGIGIPLKDQKNLFKLFYRASNAKDHQGTGIGLYILKNYVDMLKGTIQILSDEGKGTTFSILFPVPRVPKNNVQSRETLTSG